MQEDNIILVALTSGNVIVGEAIDGKTILPTVRPNF
jgi:hypothetical protein